MNAAAAFLDIAAMVTLATLAVSFVLILYRLFVGPTLPDRVLALDMLSALAIAFVAAYGMLTGRIIYIDIAIALGLVGFLATVAFARYVLRHRAEEETRS